MQWPKPGPLLPKAAENNFVSIYTNTSKVVYLRQ